MDRCMDIEEIRSSGFSFLEAKWALDYTGSVSDAIHYLQSMKTKECTVGQVTTSSAVNTTEAPVQQENVDTKEAPTPALPPLKAAAPESSQLTRGGKRHSSFATPAVSLKALMDEEGMEEHTLLAALSKGRSVVMKGEQEAIEVDVGGSKAKDNTDNISEPRGSIQQDVIEKNKEFEGRKLAIECFFDDKERSKESISTDNGSVSDEAHDIDMAENSEPHDDAEPREETRPGAFAVPGPDFNNFDHGYDDLVTTEPQQSFSPVTARLVDPDLENQMLEQRLEEELQAEREKAPLAQPFKSGWTWRRIACVAFAVSAVLAVTVSVALKFAGPKPDSPPAPPPSGIVELLSPVSFDNGTSLMNHSTPQFKAAWWLACNAHLSNYTDEQKIQRYALATLYYSTNGPKWNVKNHWLSDLDECMWFGKDDADTGQPLECVNNSTISVLMLEENNMVGAIPDEIALLKGSLVLLDFSENLLRTSIPTTIGLLTMLSNLNFRKSDITGTVPTTLGRLTRLEQCRLYDNKLKGTIPTELGRLSSLTYFRISENNLVGQLPSTAIGHLSSMEALYFFDNHLTGHLPMTSLALLSKLTTLKLHENEFSGRIPSSVGLLTTLRVLTLEKNKLTGPIPTTLAHLTALEFLDAEFNRLDGKIPTEIALLTALEELDLGNNTLTGLIPTVLGLITSLEELYLDNNRLTGFIPAVLGQLIALKDLKLSNNSFAPGSIPSTLGLLTNLENLKLKLNALTGTVPLEITLLPKLETLYLAENNLTGPLNNIIGPTISNGTRPPMSNATNDSAMSNASVPTRSKMTGPVVSNVTGRLPAIEDLDLYSNQLTGTISSEIGLLTMLTDLLLGSNKLFGPIPSEIGMLKRLEVLNFTNNSLAGTIPASIGRLTELKSIDLSNNMLMGVIPTVINNMTKLNELHLFNNSLLGEFTCPTRIPDCYLSCFHLGDDTCRIL